MVAVSDVGRVASAENLARPAHQPVDAVAMAAVDPIGDHQLRLVAERDATPQPGSPGLLRTRRAPATSRCGEHPPPVAPGSAPAGVRSLIQPGTGLDRRGGRRELESHRLRSVLLARLQQGEVVPRPGQRLVVQHLGVGDVAGAARLSPASEQAPHLVVAQPGQAAADFLQRQIRLLQPLDQPQAVQMALACRRSPVRSPPAAAGAPRRCSSGPSAPRHPPPPSARPASAAPRPPAAGPAHRRLRTSSASLEDGVAGSRCAVSIASLPSHGVIITVIRTTVNTSPLLDSGGVMPGGVEEAQSGQWRGLTKETASGPEASRPGCRWPG